MNTIKLITNKEKYEEIKQESLNAGIIPKLENLERNMKGDFLHGDLSVVDFEFYEVAQCLLRVDSKIMDKYPKLRK